MYKPGGVGPPRGPQEPPPPKSGLEPLDGLEIPISGHFHWFYKGFIFYPPPEMVSTESGAWPEKLFLLKVFLHFLYLPPPGNGALRVPNRRGMRPTWVFMLSLHDRQNVVLPMLFHAFHVSATAFRGGGT